MKNNKNLIIIALLVIAFIIPASVIIPSLIPEDILTEEEVAKIREKNNYRIYKFDPSFWGTTDFKEVSFRETVKNTDTFAYCEVIGDAEFVELEAGEMINKGATMRIHRLNVIKDSEGIFNEGDEFCFAYGLMNQGTTPRPKDGEKIILPISLIFLNGYEKDEYFAYSGETGYYYVTDDGYVISAFEEEEGCVYSGKTVDNLLKALRKTKEERESYLKPYSERYEKTEGKFGFTSIEMLKEQIKEKLQDN